ncbi:MAG: hypothetical protein CL961_06515 [Euryarchaeota archaeon]|nr:hypothetical protein [Euryarchaeota archaeon]|tara:strand:+ start:208 stop:813 length:606 start_codon:yes stop_codon:yes gene_type:complete
MEAALHPVNQNDSTDDDFISHAISLLSQQIWYWGQDIRRKQGNLLIEFGFQRVKPPADTEIEDSVYTLNLTENRSVILRGFGVYYRDNDLGAIFLPRYEFIPGYTTNLTLEQPLWTYDELPELYFPTETEWESYTTLLTDLVNWIQSYEQRVIEEQGLEYRISTLTEWDNGERKVTSPEKVVVEWEKVSCIISKMQYLDFE